MFAAPLHEKRTPRAPVAVVVATTTAVVVAAVYNYYTSSAAAGKRNAPRGGDAAVRGHADGTRDAEGERESYRMFGAGVRGRGWVGRGVWRAGRVSD